VFGWSLLGTVSWNRHGNMTLNLQQTEVEHQFDSPFLQFVARSERIKRSSGTTKTKCLKIGHL
jgi:hypothetical protein